jgi:drug/metabolite transporter (DMT)-like permease
MIKRFYGRANGTVRGMILLIISGALFAGMHGSIRLISGGGTGTEGMHPFEIAFFRNFFGLVIVVPLLMKSGLRGLRTTRFPLHAARATIQVVSMLMFFTALKLSPLADITALGFLAPLFATVGAILFLGEKARLRRWTALIIGFIGAMVILRPGFQEISLGLTLVISASAIWGGAMLMIKSLSRTESSLTTTAYMAILMTPISLVPALFFWRLPTMTELAGLFIIGLLGTVGHLCLAQAFREAEASAILPVDFTRLLWATLVGFILFAEVPGLWTWIGGGLIVAAATYVALREARSRNQDVKTELS